MTFAFRPAVSFTERAGLFVSLTGGTNSGKTFSALRLARGIAGPDGKIAVLDTEGGRTLHLKSEFAFDANVMDPPFHPQRFADAARDAEGAGYACLLIDSFSMEWVGIGGVLDWQAQEIQRMAGDDFRKQERMKMASWIKPKSAHKAMVYSFLQRRMPIVFAIRGEESIKPGEAGEKPTKIFKSVCNSQFPFEVTVSFRLDSGRKGYIDLSDPKSYKMEGAHQGIFRDGDRISEQHGSALAEWARGGTPSSPVSSQTGAGDIISEGTNAASRGMDALRSFWGRLSAAHKAIAGGKQQLDAWKAIAEEADAQDVGFDDAADADQSKDPPPAKSADAAAMQSKDVAAMQQDAGALSRAAPASDDAFPGDTPTESEILDAIWAEGGEAQRKGVARKAVPGPYREDKAKAAAWQGGHDAETRRREGGER